MITVVGLGRNEGDLTLRGAEAIKHACAVYVKTSLTPTYSFFINNNINAVSLDYMFEQAEDFDSLNNNIANFLVDSQNKNDIVYCVNGGGFDDGSVKALKDRTDIRIISAPSYADDVLGLCPSTSFSCYSASDLVEKSGFLPDKRVTLTIKEIDNRLLASEIKLILMDAYGEDCSAYIVKSGNAQKIVLNELDHGTDFDYSTVLIIPPVDLLSAERYDFSDLLQIMAVLTGEGGCPWDRAQTHQSIRINMIEEAYELVDAIDKGDINNMVEETGDVMLQAVFHCVIGAAEGEYNTLDALTCLCKKLIGRHTHIFGENKATSAAEALKFWDAAKGVEKHYESSSQKMELLPKGLPALLYAYKVQKIAAKVGFDWTDINGAFDKAAEELNELKDARSQEEILDEAGDVLFSAINPVRLKGVEPELALKAATDKFISRFKYVEQKLKKNGGDIHNIEQFDRLWGEAKAEEKKNK